jgi:hypothetical protein
MFFYFNIIKVSYTIKYYEFLLVFILCYNELGQAMVFCIDFDNQGGKENVQHKEKQY